MFARFFTLLPFVLLASASHLEARDQCSTGSIYCCNSAQTLDQASSLLATFDLLAAATNAGGLVGLTCSPVTVIGASSSGCSAQTLCCSNNEYNGLINVGCSPVNINA